jgi:dihydroxyacetone kinase
MQTKEGDKPVARKYAGPGEHEIIVAGFRGFEFSGQKGAGTIISKKPKPEILKLLTDKFDGEWEVR